MIIRQCLGSTPSGNPLYKILATPLYACHQVHIVEKESVTQKFQSLCEGVNLEWNIMSKERGSSEQRNLMSKEHGSSEQRNVSLKKTNSRETRW